MKAINEIFECLARSEDTSKDKTKIKSILNESPDHKYKITEFRQCEDLDNFIYELKQKGWVKAGPMLLREGSFKHVMIVTGQALKNVEISIYTDDEHVIDVLDDFKHILQPFNEPKTKGQILASLGEPWSWKMTKIGIINIEEKKDLLFPIPPINNTAEGYPNTWLFGEIDEGIMILVNVHELYLPIHNGLSFGLVVSVLTKGDKDTSIIRQKILSAFSGIEVVGPGKMRTIVHGMYSIYHDMLQDAIQVIKKTYPVEVPMTGKIVPSLTPPEKVKTQDVRRTIIANWLSKLTKKD